MNGGIYLRTWIVGPLLWVSCLGSLARAQSTGPQDERFRPRTLPPVLLDPGPSLSDPKMPVPEGGLLIDGAYNNPYFGFSYRLPRDWWENLEGPPPSDTGYYVLAQFKPVDASKGSSRGTILITALDKFFASRHAGSPREMVESIKASLKPPVFQVETTPIEVKVGNHIFTRFDYQAPAAELHWRILATEIRCHIVEFVFTSQDTRLLDTLVQDVDRMQPSDRSTFEFDEKEVPLCVQGYASGPSLLHKVDPIFAGPKFTRIPVRIVIDKNGKVKQMHLISAFPAQAENVKAALAQWQFKPYVRNGRSLEVETGIVFEFPPRGREPPGQSLEKGGRSY